MADSRDTIVFTLMAKLALHILVRPLHLQSLHQRHQQQQIRHPKRTPARRHHHERIDLTRIRPRPRQRQPRPIIPEKEHPILTPGVPHTQQHELPTRPRMKRMRHTNNALSTIAIGRS